MLGCRQSPRDVTTANLLKRKLVKNVVGLQKFDQELRVSYKPTAFRRWVVDWNSTLPDTVEDLIAVVDSNKSVIDHGMIEGFVLYSQDGQTSYKCVSPSFLLKYH